MFMRRNPVRAFVAATAMLVGTPIAVLAGADYPNRTIKIVVPAPPGPVLDILPRIIAEKLAALESPDRSALDARDPCISARILEDAFTAAVSRVRCRRALFRGARCPSHSSGAIYESIK